MAASRRSITGFSDRQIRITVPDATARAMGLTIEEIARAVARQNTDLPAGEVIAEGGTTLIRFADERRAVDAYRDLVVTSDPGGGRVTLGDIADIRAGFEEAHVRTEVDGRPAALLDVTKSAADDTLRVRAAIADFLTAARPTLPPTVRLQVVRDRSRILENRLTMLIENALQGLVLVFGVIWLFFGVRQAFWIALGLPVSFLGALAAMGALGLSINMLSLVALLIVIGILMDDAIVIAENIAAKREAGLAPLEAAIEGPREVGAGVIASFITTVIIFGSLAFLKGDIGEILRVVPVVMTLVLIVSLVEAFLILPRHLGHGADRDRPGRVSAWVERRVDGLRRGLVRPLVRAAVRWRYLTMGSALGLLIAALALIAGGIVKFTPFPSVEGDRIEARIELSARATLGQTERVVAGLLEALDRVDAELGAGLPGGTLVETVILRYSANADAGTTGRYLATIDVDLIASDARPVRLAEIATRWQAAAPISPIVSRLTVTEPSVGPAGRDIELRLTGPDRDALARASADLQGWLAGYRGTYNIADDLTPGKPELRVHLAEGAGSTGLEAEDIARQLRAAFHGEQAGQVQIGAETVEIEVEGAEGGGHARLDAFTVETPSGARVPLSSVARIEQARGFTRLTRIDRRPTVTITGDVDPRRGNASEIVAETLATRARALEARYPGLAVGVEGQNADAAETQASMLAGASLGLIGVFLLLAFQLRSFAEPLAIMVIIPFALIGVLAGHYAMGLDMTLPSMLGVVSLAGIVVNDSILLVNHIKRLHEQEGLSIAEAAPEGAAARFRAILLTSFTTIAGVVPLMFETSPQAQFLVPLVAAIAFGLMATTVLVLVVIPAFYTILDDTHLTEPAVRRRRGAGPTARAPG